MTIPHVPQPVPSSEEVSDFCTAAAKGDNATVSAYLNLYGSAAVDLYPPQSPTTALACAARFGRLAAVELLLDYHADIHIRDENGWTPLSRAAREGHTAIAARLLDKGARLHDRDIVGRNALMLAAVQGSKDMIALLLDRGSAIDDVDEFSNTALMHASLRGRTAAMALLLDRDADVDIRNKDGLTALDWAERRSSPAIADLIREAAEKRIRQQQQAQDRARAETRLPQLRQQRPGKPALKKAAP